MKPIYRIEFTLYAGDNRLASCEQEMMLPLAYWNHKAAEESLWRMVQSLAEELNIIDRVTGWAGFIVFDRYDSWCLHWKSHYTYYTFPDPQTALDHFIFWAVDHKDQFEGESNSADWHICGCEICEKLGRTMILHLGEKECPDCSCVS